MKRLLLILLLSLPLSAQQVNTFIPFGGVNVQTATYVIQTSDVGKLVVMNCTSCTVSLPSSIPSGYNSQWAVWILNINATSLTVSPNGLQLNGSGSNITLVTNSSIYVTTSASAYYGVQGSIGAPPGSGAASPGFSLPGRFDYTLGTGGAITCTYTGGCNGLGSQSGFSATATETNGRILSAAAAGSTNTVVGLGIDYGSNPGAGQNTLGSTSRFSMRLMTQVSTTARYWVGMMDGSGGQFSGAAQNVTDTPNVPYCAFRFSTTTDTTWKAICATNSANQTVVDTGIAISTTASTLFEITFAPAGAPTSATFYLNGSQVATVSTNLPTASYQLGHCFTVDNKNTATAESVVFFWSQLFLTK